MPPRATHRVNGYSYQSQIPPHGAALSRHSILPHLRHLYQLRIPRWEDVHSVPQAAAISDVAYVLPSIRVLHMEEPRLGAPCDLAPCQVRTSGTAETYRLG